MDRTVKIAAGFGGGDLFTVDEESAVVVGSEADHLRAVIFKGQFGAGNTAESGSAKVKSSCHAVNGDHGTAFGRDLFTAFRHGSVNGCLLCIFDRGSFVNFYLPVNVGSMECKHQ